MKSLNDLQKDLTLLVAELKFKAVGPVDGDFGKLSGIHFDSDRLGGFVYAWSSGRIEFQLVDYQAGEQIIPITVVTVEYGDISEVGDILVAEISKLKRVS